MTEWAVGAVAPQVLLDPNNRAEMTFTVTNPGDAPDRAVFLVEPDDCVPRSWFTLAEPQRPGHAAGMHRAAGLRVFGHHRARGEFPAQRPGLFRGAARGAAEAALVAVRGGGRAGARRPRGRRLVRLPAPGHHTRAGRGVAGRG